MPGPPFSFTLFNSLHTAPLNANDVLILQPIDTSRFGTLSIVFQSNVNFTVRTDTSVDGLTFLNGPVSNPTFAAAVYKLETLVYPTAAYVRYVVTCGATSMTSFSAQISGV